MKKFKFNFSFLDRFKKHKEVEEDTSSDAIHPEDEEVSYSDENPEEFAEKTLSNFNLNQYKEMEKQALQNSVNEEVYEGSEEESEEESKEESEEYEDEEVSDFKEMQGPGAAYSSDNELPGDKPEAAKRFSFKFPKFNRGETTRRIKDKFSAGGTTLNSIDRLSWNDIVLRFFSPYSRGKIHGAFVILLVVTFTYLMGKGIALFFNRQPPVVAVKSNIQIPIEKADTTTADVNKIASTNLFNVKESDKAQGAKKQVDIASIICTTADKPTSEQVKLMDTIVLQDSVKSVASVQIRGGSDLVNVREGEQITSAIEVAKINRMKIILKNLETGDCEYIAGDEDEGPAMPKMTILSPQAGKKFISKNPSIKNSGNNFQIKRAVKDQMIANISEVLTQARAIPITNPDGSLSFKMTEVVPGSIYSQLDIQNDDIITSINGKKIENLNELTGLLGKIREIDHFEIGMKRNGMSENKEYDFKN
jgi:type II secretory pathway component PulC